MKARFSDIEVVREDYDTLFNGAGFSPILHSLHYAHLELLVTSSLHAFVVVQCPNALSQGDGRTPRGGIAA